MLNNITKILQGLPFRIAACLFVAYLLIGYFAVDPLARRILPWVAEQKLASKASVDKVSFDPFGLTVTIDHFRLTQPNGAPLAGFERLYVNLETSGMFRLAWRLKDIQLTGPQATFEIGADGKLNWADLIAKLNEDKTKSDKMTRLLIDHILIERGDIDYIANNRETPFKVSLEPLGIELSGLSTLPEDRGEYLIAATLPEQGSTLKWKGDIGLNPLASTGQLQLEGINLAKLMSILKTADWPFRLSDGQLQASLAYDFSMPSDKPQVQLSNARLTLSHLSGTLANNTGKLGLKALDVKIPQLNFNMLADRQDKTKSNPQVQFEGMNIGLSDGLFSADKSPLLSLPQADIRGISLDLAAHKASVISLALTGGAVHAVNDPHGVLNWQSALALKPVPVQSMPAKASNQSSDAKQRDVKSQNRVSPPFKFAIEQIQFRHWQAGYHDNSFLHPLAVDAADINLDFALSNLSDGMVIRDFKGDSERLSIKSALYPQAATTLAKLTVEGGELNLADKKVGLQSIVLSGLQVQVLKDASNGLNWQAMFAPLPTTPPTNTAPISTSQHAATSDNTDSNVAASKWSFALQRFALDDAGVHIEDRTAGEPMLLDTQKIALEIQDITQDMKRSLPVRVSLQVNQGGQFEATGNLAAAPLNGDFKLKLSGLSLKPFSPYISRIAFLKLNDGSVNSAGRLTLKPAGATSNQSVSTLFTGGFSVNQLAINEQGNGAPFLGWERMSSDSLDVGTAPNHLHMAELRFLKPSGKLIIHEDKTLNFKRILRDQSASTAPTVAAPAQMTSTAQTATIAANPLKVAAKKPAASASMSETVAFPVQVERLYIDNAYLEFADLSLKPQFGTRINALTGVINGLSTDPSTTAQIELDGKVDDYGSARVRGSLQPFQATEFTDLKLTFHNLDMNRMTPYSGKFAGRRIDSGKLAVALEYKIRHRQLAGENQFTASQLKLGEHVDSPDATNLPLDLAIALLEDSDGVIDLNVPISGSLDDPEFSYGKVIWNALVNVLSKIITSPFRALGNLLGSSSDELQAITFDVGSAYIAPPEEEKLKTVAQAMNKRQALSLSIEPGFDSKPDIRALQEKNLRLDVAKLTGIKLQEGELPGPIDLTNSKTQDALNSLGYSRLNRSRLKNLKDSITQSNDEKYAALADLQEQLTLNVPVTEADLQTLARQRAEAIEKVLIANGIAADHLSIGPIKTQTGDGETVNVKMDLGVKSAK